MKISLIGKPDNLTNAIMGAGICVDKAYTANIENLKSALDSGHLSVVEHLNFTFLIEDVSRALTHQLVRNRIASYSQKSDRYSKIGNGTTNWFYVPVSILNNDKALKIYIEHMNNCSDIYNTLIDLGIPKEDARYTSPDGRYTSIVLTMNARALFNFFEKRLCGKAQLEIRTLAHNMRELLLQNEDYKILTDLYLPKCYFGKCPEKKPCKIRYDKDNFYISINCDFIGKTEYASYLNDKFICTNSCNSDIDCSGCEFR